MKICVPCKAIMRCEKTGQRAVWGEGHYYAGDRYMCPKCKAEVLVCNECPGFSKDVRNEIDAILMNDTEK